MRYVILVLFAGYAVPVQHITRNLVVQSDARSQTLWMKQEKWFTDSAAGIRVRDVKIIHRPGTPFRVTLYGKDGFVKMTSNMPVSPVTLFKVIDAMPMRKEEIKTAHIH